MPLFTYIHFALTELQQQLTKVETENKSLHDEFNLQRAKFKELFLQKEGKCMMIQLVSNDHLFVIYLTLY